MTTPDVIGIQFEVDQDTAIYLQRHSFLDGPEESRNRRLRSELVGKACPRHADRDEVAFEDVSGHPRELLSADDWLRLQRLGSRLGLSELEWRNIGYYYGWKLKLAHAEAPKRVLSFGSATGMECVAIKALFPDAKISAIDFNLEVDPAWLEPLGIEATYRTTLESLREQLAGGFDLIFSNHTLEHLAQPEEILRQLLALLRPGGTLVSALPLEWSPGSHSRPALERHPKGQPVHPLDVGDLHLGHLWKTSPRDVYDTLLRAGYDSIRLIRRVDYPTAWRNHRPMHRTLLRLRAELGSVLNRLTLLPFRSALKLVFSEQLPGFVVRNYFRLETRVWFSHVLLHNSTVQELTFVARRPTQNNQSF